MKDVLVGMGVKEANVTDGTMAIVDVRGAAALVCIFEAIECACDDRRDIYLCGRY